MYRAATTALSPAAGLALRLRAVSGKEEARRLHERHARNLPERPDGRLVWLHGASVGEANVLLAVAEALRATQPDLAFLFTTQTLTSADLIANRLPNRAHHIMAPIDTPRTAKRFMDWAAPDLAVFAEGEIWPNLILSAKSRGVRLALVNARMTDKSMAGWSDWPKTAQRVFGAFDTIIAADPRTRDGLSKIIGRDLPAPGNLKASLPPPPVDEGMLNATSRAFWGRRVLLAASTHKGEEAGVLDLFADLRADHEDLALIIAPRHPERAEAIAELTGARGYPSARRSLKENASAADVYIADTIGEMGLWYSLADAVYLGGGDAPGVGGHNPFEPAQLGARVVSGPHVQNFEDTFARLAEIGAAVIAETPLQATEFLAADLAGETPTIDRNRLRALADAPMAKTIDALTALLDNEA